MKTFETDVKFGGDETPVKPGDLLPHAMMHIEEELSGYGQAYIGTAKEAFCRAFWGGIARMKRGAPSMPTTQKTCETCSAYHHEREKSGICCAHPPTVIDFHNSHFPEVNNYNTCREWAPRTGESCAGAYLAKSVKHIVDAYDLPTEVEQELVKVVGIFWEDQK